MTNRRAWRERYVACERVEVRSWLHGCEVWRGAEVTRVRAGFRPLLFVMVDGFSEREIHRSTDIRSIAC